MMEIDEPEFDAQGLADAMRQEAKARREVASRSRSDDTTVALLDSLSPASMTNDASTRADGPTVSAIPAEPLALQPPFQPRADHRYHVRDLLQYHDRNFIQNAYLAILKRGPDATGFRDFIEALRSGRLNKIDILARLRYSAEGRAKKVHVEGLLMPAVIRQSYRVPLLGYLFQLLVALARLPSILRGQQQFEAHVLAQQEQMVDYANATRAWLAALARQQQARLAEIVSELRALDERVAAGLSSTREQLQLLDARLAQEGAARNSQVQSLSAQLRDELERASQQLRAGTERSLESQQQLRRELVLHGQRVTRLLDNVARRLETPLDEGQLRVLADEERHGLDAFYLSFEDQFRGDRSEIKERLKIYLPLLEQARIGTDEMPILDVGSGRGEWLELLRERNLRASGVDLNRALLAECREHGLEVVEADALGYLRALPDESLGAVTGFHLVEHLPIEKLVYLLDETVRVVKPGGACIFETPNPENVLVGSCNFYFDPTHRNPLPSPIMRFLVESRGFARVRVIELNPSNAERVAGDSDLIKRFNQYFYGPMDYAVVGWKV